MHKLLILTWLFATIAAAQEPEDTSAASGDSPAANAPASDEAERPQASAPATNANTATAGVKTMSGMSILGNEEAPKALVIVPWKSSVIGDGIGVTNSLDDRAKPVDRDVFMREVHYYELRSGDAK